MGNNKVSEKAIWEGAISPDNDTPSIGSQMQTQSQMMFCYKCNNVIPSNSTFCPYCQIKLFVECPKCSTKYSSQYPACNNCGTNREEYLRAQRREQERKEAIERENRRKRLEEERRRKEAEAERKRQERLRRYEQQEKERKLKEAYRKENDKIMKTKEYETTYSLINEALKRFERRCKQKRNIAIFSCIIYFIIYFLFFLIVLSIYDGGQDNALFVIIMLFTAPTPIMAINYIINNKDAEKDAEKKVKFILRYIKKRNVGCDKHMMEYVISKIQANELVDVSKCCIEAYRIKNNLPVGYKKY